jgi:hypothetical protein
LSSYSSNEVILSKVGTKSDVVCDLVFDPSPAFEGLAVSIKVDVGGLEEQHDSIWHGVVLLMVDPVFVFEGFDEPFSYLDGNLISALMLLELFLCGVVVEICSIGKFL